MLVHMIIDITGFKRIMEFFLNVSPEFTEFSDKNICNYSKRSRSCHPGTSCVRDQDDRSTTVSTRHM